MSTYAKEVFLQREEELSSLVHILDTRTADLRRSLAELETVSASLFRLVYEREHPDKYKRTAPPTFFVDMRDFNLYARLGGEKFAVCPVFYMPLRQDVLRTAATIVSGLADALTLLVSSISDIRKITNLRVEFNTDVHRNFTIVCDVLREKTTKVSWTVDVELVKSLLPPDYTEHLRLWFQSILNSVVSFIRQELL